MVKARIHHQNDTFKMSLYMSPFKLDLPQTFPLQYSSGMAYTSVLITDLR